MYKNESYISIDWEFLLIVNYIKLNQAITFLYFLMSFINSPS